MFYETIISTFDRSYYTDRLEELTGKSRTYWSHFSIFKLERQLKKELMKRTQFMEVSHEN